LVLGNTTGHVVQGLGKKTQHFPRKTQYKTGEKPAIKKTKENNHKKTGADSAFPTGPSYHLSASELGSDARKAQCEIEERLHYTSRKMHPHALVAESAGGFRAGGRCAAILGRRTSLLGDLE
jgi:hypothetical protein